jgi:hypothetical protein
MANPGMRDREGCVRFPVRRSRLAFTYPRRKRRILGDRFTSRHFGHGHLKVLSFGKTMWPHISQICRPLERTFMGLNSDPKTQYGQRGCFAFFTCPGFDTPVPCLGCRRSLTLTHIKKCALLNSIVEEH